MDDGDDGDEAKRRLSPGDKRALRDLLDWVLDNVGSAFLWGCGALGALYLARELGLFG